MRTLVRNNYFDLDLFKGFALGFGYEDQLFTVVVGCFALSVKTWMFKSR